MKRSEKEERNSSERSRGKGRARPPPQEKGEHQGASKQLKVPDKGEKKGKHTQVGRKGKGFQRTSVLAKRDHPARTVDAEKKHVITVCFKKELGGSVEKKEKKNSGAGKNGKREETLPVHRFRSSQGPPGNSARCPRRRSTAGSWGGSKRGN